MKKSLMSILCLLSWAHASLLWAQPRIDTRVQYGVLLPELSYQSWKRTGTGKIPARFKGEVRQIATPLFISYPVSREMRLFVTQTNAFSTLADEAENSLNGLGNTRVKVLYMTADRRLLLTGGVGFPTGNPISTDEEREVSRALFSDLLDFSVRRYGEGFNMEAGAAWAQKVGSFALSTGVSYLYRGSYDTWVNEDTTWNPEDEIRLTGRINWLKRRLVWRSGITYAKFLSDDEDDGLGMTGRLLIENSFARTGRRLSLSIDTFASLTTAKATYKWPKTILGSSVVGRYTITRSFSLRSVVQVKHIPDDDTGVARAWLYTFGPGAQMRVVRGIKLDAVLKFSTGHEYVATEDNTFLKLDIRGFGFHARILGYF